MKIHYINILLFSLPLNLLVTLYQAHNKNKTYIIRNHTPRYTSRMLSEKDEESSIYDRYAEMKSVKEHFDRQTSKRFEEYEERMKDKRQKRKEERDKNIQKIIEKDKMEKSLEEKIEKGCLRCGCALGGGVLPVWGLVSGLWYATLSQHVTKMAIQKGIEAGIKKGLAEIKNIFEMSHRQGVFPEITVDQMLSSGKFTNGVNLFDMAKHISTMNDNLGDTSNHFWTYIYYITQDEAITEFNTINSTRIAAVTNAFEKGKAAEFALHTSLLSNTIIASVVTILVIVLVMIIIYLVLRYRRKKKKKKKAQYTKLLKE
ncbi:rifin PIR protein, putative [Plasmodium reichenowi]|uniref:Rifin PIR protein, putative n=1 Tax=Plasmodium reichenowi TaxID=5854 RepID=A0A2P9D1D5_PLARE|nr:rifin PIR protein, putative [Plasmodium reichenowi]